MDKVIDRLRKLMRHKESAEEIGSLAEAEAFAAKIQQLLIEHKLEMEEVTAASGEVDEEVGEQMFGAAWSRENGLPISYRRVWWMEDLAGYVARAHFCELLIAAGTNAVWFVGKASDRAVAAYVYATLAKSAIELCDKEFAAAKKERRDLRMFRHSFLTGFTGGISRRLRAQRAAADESSESTALVLKRSDAAVEKFIEDKFQGKKSRLGDVGNSSRGFNRDAYQRGTSAGETVAIGRAVANSSRRGIAS